MQSVRHAVRMALAPLRMQCADAGATIAAIRFASFGTPSGSCPAFADGPCSAKASLGIVENACLGNRACTVNATNDQFGGDPCPGTSKQLVIVAHCSQGGGFQPNAALPPADRQRLPAYVSSVTLQTPGLGGFCGARLQWTNGSSDPRALEVRRLVASRTLSDLLTAIACRTLLSLPLSRVTWASHSPVGARLPPSTSFSRMQPRLPTQRLSCRCILS